MNGSAPESRSATPRGFVSHLVRAIGASPTDPRSSRLLTALSLQGIRAKRAAEASPEDLINAAAAQVGEAATCLMRALPHLPVNSRRDIRQLELELHALAEQLGTLAAKASPEAPLASIGPGGIGGYTQSEISAGRRRVMDRLA